MGVGAHVDMNVPRCIWEPQVGIMSSLIATFYILILDLSPEPKTYQFN